MVYRIKSIKHTGRKGVKGTNRTDGRYPLRIGRICEFNTNDIQIGFDLIWQYLEDNKGNPMSSRMRTSNVLTVEIKQNSVIIQTLNSIYELEPISNYQPI